MISLFVLPDAGAGTPTWDCRTAADGRSWQCFKDGQAVSDPAPPGQTVTTPADPPADRPATPLTADEAAAAPVAPPPPAAVEPPASQPPDTAGQARYGEGFAQPDGPAAPDALPSEPVASQGAAAAGAGVGTAAQAFQPGDVPDLTADGPSADAATVAPAPRPQPEPVSVAVPDHRTGDGAAPTPSVATDADTAQARPSAVGAYDARIDQGIDWGSCTIGADLRSGALDRLDTEVGDAPIEISADDMVTELDAEQTRLHGNVHLVHGDVQLWAQQVQLDRRAGKADAQGELLLTTPDIRFSGASARYDLDSRRAEVSQASYRVPAIRARGDAERAAFLGDGISRFGDISYTTCAPGNSSWLLTADELELDQNQGFGTATHASLRFLGVPMLYLPRFTFPIDDRRRSGVLVPTVGYSGNTGGDISVPYYFNLAENYDLTLTPRLMTKRGLMLSGEFRFLTESSHGTLAADLLPDDGERDEGSSTRGAVSLKTHTRFNARTQGNLRLGYVSDSDYLSDLGSSLAATSATHVERTGEVIYNADTWDLLGRVQYYQTIDDAIDVDDRPYSQLPLIRLGLENAGGPLGTTYHLDAEYANFYRRDSVRGHRVDLAPAVSLPLGNAWWFAEPKLGARYTAYDLTDQTAGRDASPSHGTALLSLDSGLYFDRKTSYFGHAATHTLEPRVYYLFVPASSQSDQPVFDSTALDFNFDNLFRENRFNGPDRVGDANQITLALTSRVIGEASGEELLRASIGQILYFDDRDVTLPGESEADDSTSAVVGEVGARLSSAWRARAGLQWDPHDGDDGTIDQALAQVSYRDEQRHVFNAAYRLRDGLVRQSDVAFFWPLNERLSLVGRHYYSLRDSRLLEALAGIEYGKCCWRIRALARKYTDSDGDDHNLAFMLQLELNGLGRLGDDIDSTLERGIYGYRIDDDD